jgi:hypothetical protein
MEEMKGYNALNDLKIDWKKTGICPTCSLRMTDPKCTHATLEQRMFVHELDGEFDKVYGTGWETSADRLHEILEQEREEVETASILEWLGPVEKTPDLKLVQSTQKVYPSYHDLIWGAKLTDEHRADIHKTWNERYNKGDSTVTQA